MIEVFTAVMYGIELVCSIEYTPPEGDGVEAPAHNEGADCMSVSVDGWDITQIVGDVVLREIEAHYLDSRKEEIEQERTERRIESMRSAQHES